jgi:DNA-binding response OmpR family regulator
VQKKIALIIDESPLFREYLKYKFGENGVDTDVAVNVLEGLSKMRILIPDLIVLDYHLANNGCIQVLQEKKASISTVKIPVIVIAQEMEQRNIIGLAAFNVKKVFTKPVIPEALFVAFSEALGIPFEIDDSQGLVDVHVNDNIIFIEIAQGLNRDKVELLRFKIRELIELYGIRVPKIIIMLSNIKLSFADGPNIEMLMTTVIAAAKTAPENIKVLTTDEFTRLYISRQKEYQGIEVVDNLQKAMGGFLAALDNVLSVKGDAPNESMQFRFDGDAAKKLTPQLVKEYVQNLHIGAVDDDFVIQELIKNTFQKVGAQVKTYSDGSEFLEDPESKNLDLVFLDLMMPNVDGFAVLRKLRTWDIKPTVIVLTAMSKREAVIEAFQMGVKSYLIKPLKPDDIFKKSLEIMKPSF